MKKAASKPNMMMENMMKKRKRSNEQVETVRRMESMRGTLAKYLNTLKYIRKKLMARTLSSETMATPMGMKSMYSTVTEL